MGRRNRYACLETRPIDDREKLLGQSDSGRDLEILYIADPMCSWCWGFAPTARMIKDHFDAARFTIVVGGLRPGENAEPLDEQLKRVIEPHWRRVRDVSGQPFDFSFFEREGFLFDTEPACRAVVAVRQLAPDKTFGFFCSMQEAFYARNIDITDPANLDGVLREHEIDEAAFMQEFDSDETQRATYRDFAEARRLGAQGFPSVALRNAERIVLLTVGYQPYQRLSPPIHEFFGLTGAEHAGC